MDAITRDKQLINDLGGPSKVAEMLGLPKLGGQQRVQNWLARGIPAAVKVDRPDLFMPELAAISGPKQPVAQQPRAQAAPERVAAHPTADAGSRGALERALSEAGRAGLIERRNSVRRAADRERAGRAEF
ncbi:MAG: putative phage protein [Polaromonas sp.]|nr:putative phage protein [Polaromonas sp.]